MNKLILFVLVIAAIVAINKFIAYVRSKAFIDIFTVLFIIGASILLINVTNRARAEVNS